MEEKSKKLKDFFKSVVIDDDDAITQYVSKCEKEAVDLDTLMKLDESHLKDLNIKMGHRLAIINFTQNSCLAQDDMNVDNKYLRRDYYCHWANSKDVGNRYDEIVHLMKIFFENHIIAVDINSTEYKEDILFSFIGKLNPKSQFDEFEASDIRSSNVEIFDHCLNQPIIISEGILKEFKRHTACSNVKAIGYQHIYKHKMIDTDTSATDSSMNDMFSSTSIDDILDENESQEPTRKKRKVQIYKTCQLKIFQDCQGLLLPHEDNSTRLSYTMTKLEILILCPRNTETICRKITAHLGLIFIEDMFKKIEKNAKNKNLSLNVTNAEAKLYPLFQSYVAQSLILGCSNISLTCDLAIFKNMNSNIKCMIFSNEDKIRSMIAKPLVNMVVQIKNDSFVEYLSAVSEIIDFTLKFKVSIPAVYCISNKVSKTFYNCNVSAVGIIPLYILKFLTEKKFAAEKAKESMF